MIYLFSLTWLWTGIISGLISSSFFLVFLFTLRPRIAISDHVCQLTFENVDYYTIKVINKTRFRIHDVKAELWITKPYGVKGGKNIKLDIIELKKSELFSIDPFNANNKEASYAVLFSTSEDLNQRWDNDAQNLRFRIIAKHSFSGFSRIYEKEYHSKANTLKKANFEFGNSFAICA